MATKFNRNFKSKLFIIAHSLVRVHKITFSEALSISWKNMKLKVFMHEGGVHFQYQKKDGSLRETFGTLHNIEHLLVGSNKFQSDTLTLRYFDLEKKDFRAFKMINLISVEQF